jgi:ribonucleoside-diphosphate reductase alpha chain
MSLQKLTINELKAHYEDLYRVTSAAETTEQFQNYLQQVVAELAEGLDISLDLIKKDIADEVICKTRELGALESLRRVLLPIAEGANYKATNHPDWSLLAGRLEIQRIKLLVPETFSEMLNIDASIWTQDYYQFCQDHSTELEAMLVPERDYQLYFFGMRTLEKSYLMRILEPTQVFLETPQRMYLRIAAFLWMPNLEMVKKYYDLMSTGHFTHASPTMFHSGINKGSLASCFLLSMQDDLEKIFRCLGQCAMISKAAGGIGLDISSIRHSSVGHFGKSSGIVPMLKVYDAGMRYVDQGGRRKGSATIFLQPWHIDFPDFLLLKRQQGAEERRARDLFYAVWNCDIFMDRVKADAQWSLFCPKYAPKLKDTFGEDFERWYLYYEKELAQKSNNQKFMRQMPARQLWNELLTTQIEAGMPFMANKDTANYTSNQRNLGLIRSSNLCMEITEVTDGETISSCNLASIALDEYINFVGSQPVYDHEKLGAVTRLIVRGLNRVIDRTFYPVQERDALSGEIVGPGPIKRTNLKYRPLGLGVQALADTFLKMNLAWTDPEARKLNQEIFATIYYHATDESVEIAKEQGSYEGFEGSPAQQGLLKPDLMALEISRKQLRGKEWSDSDLKDRAEKLLQVNLSTRYDWSALRQKVSKHGLRNSLLVALMPTASTAQVRYKNESFEPFTTNMYVRSVLAGNHLIVNRYMVKDLQELGLWNKSVINFIIKNEGSINKLPVELVKTDLQPQLVRLKDKYKTAFEISQKLLVNMAIDRAYYVCQSQSLNIHSKNPTFSTLTSLHFYAWEQGLTTGMYYLRTAPATEAVKFTVEGELDVKKSMVCTDEVCLSCQ